jgi:hypothetical protein
LFGGIRIIPVFTALRILSSALRWCRFHGSLHATEPALHQPRREPPTGPRFAPANISPGGKSSRVAGPVAPHRVTDEVTLLCAIPAFRGTVTLAVLFLLRREQSVRVNWSELLLLAKQAGFRFPQSSRAFARALFGGSNAHLHHTVDLVLGTSGGRFSVRCVNTPASCLRRNSCLHHSTISRGGNDRPKYFPLLCR